MRIVLSILLTLVLCAAGISEAITPQQLKKIDKLKKDVVELFKQGNYKQAIPLLKDILSMNPRDRTASRHLIIAEQQVVEPFCRDAVKAYQSGEYEKAIHEWEKIMHLNPNETRVEKLIDMTRNLMEDNTLESMYALVDKFLKEGNYEYAVNELEKILQIKPDDKRAQNLLASSRQAIINARIKEYYERAEAHMKEGNYDAAIEEWESILDIDENQEAASRLIASARRMKLDTLYADAIRSYEQGNYAASLEIYYKILAENPTDEDVKKTINTLDRLVNVVQKIEDEGLVWDMLRKALTNHIAIRGNKKAAVAAAWYAVQLEPGNPVAADVRDFLEREHLSVVRAMEPPVSGMNIIDQYLDGALTHIYEGRYVMAVQQSSIVVELQPENVLALKRLGSAYFAMGKKDKARDAWKKALELSPKDKELKQFIRQTK